MVSTLVLIILLYMSLMLEQHISTIASSAARTTSYTTDIYNIAVADKIASPATIQHTSTSITTAAATSIIVSTASTTKYTTA